MQRSLMSVLALVVSCVPSINTTYGVIAADASAQRQVTAADMPRIPHTEAADALATFRLAAGFQLEVVATEPLVSDPVAACFDESGRMFVAEMHGYPFSHEPTKLNPSGGGKKDAGIIRLLEDTDGDGRMDRSVIYADQISWPTSVCCYNGGVFVLAPGYLYYFKDTDGDHKADIREVVLSGFGRDNVQALANGLQWGLDNKITFSAGRNPRKLLHRGQPLASDGSSDLRFDPKTEEFELVTGGLQFGHSIDDWGTRFVCSNSNHIQQVVFPQEYLSRNPYIAAPSPIRSIAVDGASARVFRLSPPEPWRIVRQKWRAEDKGYKLVINKDGAWEFIPLDPTKKTGGVPTEYPVGFFTSATGITIYRGNAYPDEFRGNAFVGDVGGNLVHRKTIDSDGVVYRAERADKNEEIIRSSDNWFRPVNFVNAPDGSLYMLDMYRETIEHPYSIPEEIKAFLDLTSGHDRGRIYRLVSPKMKRITPARLGGMSGEALAAELNSDNAWNRMTAQRLLWEQQDSSVAPILDNLLASSGNAVGRAHMLNTLAGLNLLKPDHVKAGFSDKHPRVRAHAVRLSERFLKTASESEVLAELLELCDDDSEHVRFQLAFTLGEASDDRAGSGLVQLALDGRNGPETQTAILSSVSETADKLAALLIRKDTASSTRAMSLLTQLGQIAGSKPQTTSAAQMLSLITGDDVAATVQHAILSGLGKGLAARGSTVSRLLVEKSISATTRDQVAMLFARAVQSAGDDGLTFGERESAIRLLAFADSSTATSSLPEFLSPQTAQQLQRAAVASLAEHDSDEIASTLLAGWKTYGPQVRQDVVDALVEKTSRIQALLQAVESDVVKRSDLARDRKQFLMNHPNSAVSSRSRKLFGDDVDSDRAKVVAGYQDVLDLAGDVARGQAVFKKICSACHRVGDVGQQVAPDLASVKNKSDADLLIAILDPNREAQPNFNVYTVVTNQGRVFNGIVATESAGSITLKRAEGKQDVILRSNIDQMISTGLSLMPVGLEKDLKRQDIADVIAFVKSIKPPQESGPQNQ
ncbi:MAG: c-type cytochrome [Rhodopirellula sp.]|nr:c-type cytochrome [Rhodopirellula sp.]